MRKLTAPLSREDALSLRAGAVMERFFARPPEETVDGIPCFGRAEDGDCFDAADVAQWRGGRLAANWAKSALLDNPATRPLVEGIAADEPCLIDLACGPGLGFLPAVNQLRPGFHCMGTDANPAVLREWRRFFDQRQVENIALAQCSLMALPFRDGTVQAFSSMIGLSSTRSGETGYAQALAEIHRALAPGGRLYAVEAEWADVPGILRLFEQLEQQPWAVFREPMHTWHDRFLAVGFSIVYERQAEMTFLRPEDNELGAAAARAGVKVGLRRTAFILQK